MNKHKQNHVPELSKDDLYEDFDSAKSIMQRSYLHGKIPTEQSCEKIYSCLLNGSIETPELWSFIELFCLLEWCMILKLKIQTEKCLLTILIDKIYGVESCYSVILMGLEYDHTDLELCSNEPNYNMEILTKLAIKSFFGVNTLDYGYKIRSAPQLMAALMCIENARKIKDHVSSECILNMSKIRDLAHVDRDIIYGLFMLATQSINSVIKLPNTGIDVIDESVNSSSIACLKGFMKELDTGLTFGLIDRHVLGRWAKTGLYAEKNYAKTVSETIYANNYLIAGVFFNGILVAFSQTTNRKESIKSISFVEAAIPGRSLGPLVLFYLLAVLVQKDLTTSVQLINAADISRRHIYGKLGFKYETSGNTMVLRNIADIYSDYDKSFDILSGILVSTKLTISEYDILGHYIQMAINDGIRKQSNMVLYEKFMNEMCKGDFYMRFNFDAINTNEENEFDTYTRSIKRRR
jgi:hypothetical protein